MKKKILLGIIALIAIPATTGIIEEARISSYTRSSEGIVHATENYYNQHKLGNVENVKGNLYEEIMKNIRTSIESEDSELKKITIIGEILWVINGF